jgi:hypothetical protein
MKKALQLGILFFGMSGCAVTIPIVSGPKIRTG